MKKKIYTYKKACNYVLSKGKKFSDTFEKTSLGFILKEDLK